MSEYPSQYEADFYQWSLEQARLLRSGEWKDAKKPFQLMLIGLAIIILASGLLGYSNTLS